MKRSIVMAVVGFGLSFLIAGSGSAFAGENDFPAWESWGPVETGSLITHEDVRPPEKSISESPREKNESSSDFHPEHQQWLEYEGE